jgi:Domain of unknown function (DUF3850)
VTRHELKIWPQYFSRVADGTKTFEVRKNDRGFQLGDTICLKEFDPDEEWLSDNGLPGQAGGWINHKGKYSGRELEFTIGYVLPIDAERVVFSLLKATANAAGVVK